MTSWFWVVVGVLAVQRLAELAVNRLNVAWLREKGGRVVEEDGYRWIVPVHVLWFAGLVVEFVLAPWAGWWVASWGFVLLFALGEGVRLWAMASLGRRWTTRVVVVPGERLVEGGPYRVLDHPIYVGVVVVLAAVPLVFGLWVTAGVVFLLNAFALRRRVRVEEEALAGVNPRVGV